MSDLLPVHEATSRRAAGGLRRLLDRFASMGVRPDDDEAERFRKQTITLVFTLCALVLVASGLRLQALSLHSAALIQWVFALLLSAEVVALAVFKRGTSLLVTLAIALNQLLSAAITVALGGFVGSGANPFWALLGPLAALVFQGPRRAIFWFSVYAVHVTAIVNLVDLYAPAPDPAFVREFLVFNTLLCGAVILSTLAYVFAGRERALAALSEERTRSETLLLNVLPSEVADRLKRGDASIAHHENVTVMFADLVGFTPLSADTRPEALVALLGEVFDAFDALAEVHGVEKIKTIGDCYMAACGAPEGRADHAQAICRFALALKRLMAERTFGGRKLVFRIGIHSGPAVAGVIGRKRFLYDLWGDTVNTASRMEQQGVPGEIQVSEATRALLGERFAAQERGVLPVKGKGEMRLFLLVAEPAPARTDQAAV